jgi:hypothetical protein
MKFGLPIFRHHSDDLILGRTSPFSFFPSFRIRAWQRSNHMYVLGITGQGKSKLLQHCILQDILAGQGCGLLDPHTDLVQDLLAQLAARGFFADPKNVERLIYFDPSRSDYLIPFNVLNTSSSPYATAINVVEAFRRTWPESLREAPRFTNVLLASLLVLIANHLTLVELPRLLIDREFREQLLSRVDNHEVVSVFHDRLEKWGREKPLILESILNKVGALTLNPALKLMLGQQDNRLDFRRIMDEGRVLIADLGRCDGETRRLAGSLIVTGLEQAALSRKDEPAGARRPFYFYMDEMQDFCANEGSAMTLAQILSESRKFRLHLTLAQQTLGGIESERMRAALGNIGTKVVFAVDRADAEIMAKKLFAVDGERVKHAVADDEAQERSHPVYYSLAEGWERGIQAIQNMQPRMCLVKAPQRSAAQVYTMTVPNSPLTQKALAELRQALARKDGQPCLRVGEAIEERGGWHPGAKLMDYEPPPPPSRQTASRTT